MLISSPMDQQMQEVLRRYRRNSKKPFPDLVFKHTPKAPASSSRAPTRLDVEDNEESDEESDVEDSDEDE